MDTKASGHKFPIKSLSQFRFGVWTATLAVSVCGSIAAAGPQAGVNKVQQTTTAEDFLRVPVRPVAIGHHGVGPNLGGDPTIPIENTVDSVRQAYSLGARVVEVDVQLTQDGKLAVFHDDFLSDFTCIDSLTIDQLQARLPYVPELHQVLDVARQFNNKAGAALGGIMRNWNKRLCRPRPRKSTNPKWTIKRCSIHFHRRCCCWLRRRFREFRENWIFPDCSC
jgi:hypothetical protein